MLTSGIETTRETDALEKVINKINSANLFASIRSSMQPNILIANMNPDKYREYDAAEFLSIKNCSDWLMNWQIVAGFTKERVSNSLKDAKPDIVDELFRLIKGRLLRFYANAFLESIKLHISTNSRYGDIRVANGWYKNYAKISQDHPLGILDNIIQSEYSYGDEHLAQWAKENKEKISQIFSYLDEKILNPEV